MSTNTIFVILASIIIILVLVYLIAVKRGKAKEMSSQSAIPSEPTEEDDEEL